MTKAGLHIPDFVGQDDANRPLRHANEFWDHYGVVVHDELRDAGDLIFFSRHGSFPTHIGIVRDKESYIHAPGKDGTRVKIADISYTALAKNALHHQLFVRNPIGFKSPVTTVESPTYRYHQKII